MSFARALTLLLVMPLAGQAQETAPTPLFTIAPAPVSAAIDFVVEINRQWSQDNPAALAALESVYADRVMFFGNDWTREQVLLDKRNFARRWPVRDYTFRGSEPESSCSDDGACQVFGEVDWTAYSPDRGQTSTGTARVQMRLIEIAGTYEIAFEESTVIRREITSD